MNLLSEFTEWISNLLESIYMQVKRKIGDYYTTKAFKIVKVYLIIYITIIIIVSNLFEIHLCMCFWQLLAYSIKSGQKTMQDEYIWYKIMVQ